LINPKKADYRPSIITVRDGNNNGARFAYNGTYSSIETFGAVPFRIYTADMPRITVSYGGNFGVANTAPGYQFTLGNAGAGATMAWYGNTAGYLLFKAPDNIVSPFTTVWPSVYPAAGKVMKVASVSGGVVTLEYADDNTGGGGSGGGSTQATQNF
jgi:hypothetical protein